MAEKVKLAIVGCGAVSDIFHLPVATQCDDVEVTVLVDKLSARAQRLADKFNVANITDDHNKIVDQADAAIVAVPHHIHAPITVDLLAKGIHVLVEKPMAMKVADCDAMIQAANKSGAILSVGMQRRFSNASRFVKGVIENGLLGRINSFDLREGAVYGWPVEDKAMLTKEVGGGVVTGTGVHALDLLLWWLGDYSSAEYYEDAMGGVEADCEFHIKLQNGASGIVEFSRTRNLRNTWQIRGENGVLEVDTGVNAQVRLTAKGQNITFAGRVVGAEAADETVWDLIRRQLEDFTGAIRDKRAPFITGEDGKRAIKLVEQCEVNPKRLNLPWLSPETISATEVN